ncbi:PP2C family protein-serine/threonine phosphatase [Amycolatopsis sp. OK19-0408]|uniref:PP2C family protein-serine/threonine phosphatase n=1 Tax=Amycolatopsis iheyensis TaxID=2945988 RepID=A0A9X2SPC8_9PSEU|nr:PP2C family protein-serine/threonine phosphatase [Amycolatopsis iheyensis]MCR6487405.1 PP2C family protein-serine/threonine phosphatase [Amycolatopsis iheyensis]
MSGTTALLVADSEDPAPELERVLRAEDIGLTKVSAAEFADRPGRLDADVLLVSASLGLQRVALIAQRVALAGASATLLVFPEGEDFRSLEACARGGFDFVVPPYLPGLLRSRMTSCWERWQLTMTVEEMAAAASVREYERDLSIAREIQSGFLPQELPAAPGWEFASRFRPARQVAGDFYDGFELVNGRRLGFVVADVCDKGIGAALFMALIRTLLRHTAEHTGTWSLMDAGTEESAVTADTAVGAGAALPPLLSLGAGPLIQAVLGTNRYMARNHLRQGYFATVFFGVLDPASGALLYINGGHNPPVLVRADGGHELLTPTGPAVGMMPGSAFTLGHTSLQRGDTLFLYTDGVVEARDRAGALFGMDRMTAVAARGGTAAEQLLLEMEDSLSGFVSGAEQSDDITMLALHRRGR